MRIAIFTHIIYGHHLEYIHHIYEMAVADDKNEYVFILPHKFLEVKDCLAWDNKRHIDWCFFEDNLGEQTLSFFSQIVSSFRICSFLRHYIRHYKCDVLYVNSLMHLLPMAPVMLGVNSCKVFGVIYKIYLYDAKGSFISDTINRIKYTLFSKSFVFSNVLILNDSDSAGNLNRIYSTEKFQFIPDPYIKLPVDHLIDIRQKYHIDSAKVVFSHIGALSVNKSTIEILTSLKYLDNEAKKHYVFIFAGVVHDEIKEEFYQLLKSLDPSVHVLVEDRFCTYEEIASLCVGSNALLLPYKRTSQSSGIIGYASQFGCPVIATSSGLLGKLVKQYNLGILIDDITPECLMNAYRCIEEGKIERPSMQYCEAHHVEQFQFVIKSCINQIASNIN